MLNVKPTHARNETDEKRKNGNNFCRTVSSKGRFFLMTQNQQLNVLRYLKASALPFFKTRISMNVHE